MFIFVRWLFGVLARPVFRFTSVHPEHIPSSGPVLVVANHASYLDPPLMGASIMHRSSYFFSRASLFRFPVIRGFLRSLNAFPVKTTGDWREGMHVAMDLLRRGNVVVAFPEGTRSRDGQLQKAKPGIGYLAHRAKVVVVPAFIHGAYDALPRGRGMLKFNPIKVVFGPPLDLSQEYQSPDSRETYHRIVDAMMAGIRRAGGIDN